MKNEPTCEIDKYGTKTWKLDGKLHRVDGAAIEYITGDKEWYQNGQIHREDGPALEYSNGQLVFWYYRGEEFNVKSTKEFMRVLKLKAFW
jgi:hypothetical protein